MANACPAFDFLERRGDYDPSTGTFAATGNMLGPIACHEASRLGNGKVLIAGGYDSKEGGVPNAELYDPAPATFTATGRYRLMDTRIEGHGCPLAGCRRCHRLLPDRGGPP